jgi:penicillin amidase
MRRIQADDYSLPAHRLTARLLKYRPRNDAQRRAQAYLAAWSGRMEAGSQAATLFNAWTRALRRELLLDDLRGYWNRSEQAQFVDGVADGIDLDTLERMLADTGAGWCDDRGSQGRESCDDVLGRALDQALAELNKIDGDPSMQGWAWGDVHDTLYRHTPFSDVNVLRSVFQRRLGSGGSPDTVNVANVRLEPAGRYVQTFGAGFRQVFAMGPRRTEHLYMNSTGQSGNVMSRHYDDMVAPFGAVQLLPMPARTPAPRAEGVLTLAPAPATAAGTAR